MCQMLMGGNNPEPGDLGAGSLLYKGHMIQTLVISGTSDCFHRCC